MLGDFLETNSYMISVFLKLDKCGGTPCEAYVLQLGQSHDRALDPSYGQAVYRWKRYGTNT